MSTEHQDIRLQQQQQPQQDLSFLNQSDTMTLLNSNNYLDQLVPIIKNSLKNDTVEDLVATLTQESRKRDDELVALIRSKEQEINTSTKDVGSISKHANIINEQILDINDHLHKTSQMTVTKKFQLLSLKKNITKIKESEILITKVLQVLELADSTHSLIKENNFFKALKNLADLNSLNSDFDQDFTFLQRINSSLPVLRKIIQDESISSLRRNLNSPEVLNFEELGQRYDLYFKQLIGQWDSFKRTNVDFAPYKINSSVELSLRASYAAEGVGFNVEELIDIGFIYDTFLVFSALDQLTVFKEEFNKELAIRRDKLLYPFINTPVKNEEFDKYIKADSSHLKSFLLKLSGFLIFHSFLDSAFPDVLNQATRDVWENIDTKIYQYLKNLILQETFDLSKINELKSIIGTFYLTLEQFNLDSDRFYNLLIHTFKKFTQLNSAQFRRDFEALAKDDDSMPMIIHEYKLYRKITNVGWYVDPRSEPEIKFPQVLPFSTIYPMTCAQIRNYINQEFAFFKDHFRFDLEGIQKFVVENIEGLFVQIIDPYFKSKMDSITREELSQTLVNLENFIVMNTEIGHLLGKLVQRLVVLKSGDRLRETKKITENKLFEMIDGKINDFIDFIDYDWTTEQTNSEPNYFIKDIGDFLKNMFNSTFTNLPYSVKTLLLYRVFDLLATMFLEELNAQSKLSTASILNFDKDISYIENVITELNQTSTRQQQQQQQQQQATTASSSSSSAESLQTMFLQLRQTINLLKSGSLVEYSDQTTRMRKYDQIKHEKAVQLIQKLQSSSDSNGATFNSPSSLDHNNMPTNGYQGTAANGSGASRLTPPTEEGRIRRQISSSTSMLFSKFRGGPNP